MRTPSVLLVSSVLAACGPTTFVGFCEQSAGAQCRQLFRCYPDDAKALYADAADCEVDLKAKTKCEQFETLTCTLDTGKANTCLSDIENAACAREFSLPASCQAEICKGMTSTTGDVTCRSTDYSGGGATCTLEIANCTDSKTYVIDCASSGACSCKVDGTVTKSITVTSPCSLQASDLRAQFVSKCDTKVK